jgi:hypothetical protein
MKHLKEYEEEDVRDLMGDLETIGHEQLKGWYIGTISEDGYFSIYAILAYNEGEVEQMIREDWEWAYKRMPEKIGNAYKGRNNLFNNFLDALLSNLMGEDELKFYQMHKGLIVKNPAGKKPTILNFPGYNPILATEKLEELFSNIKQKMSEEKDDFEEESTETTFPDLK